MVHKKEVPVEVAKTVAACLKVEGKQRQLLDVVWTACLDRVKLQASWLTHGQQQGSVVVKIEHLHSELRTLNMSRVQVESGAPINSARHALETAWPTGSAGACEAQGHHDPRPGGAEATEGTPGF